MSDPIFQKLLGMGGGGCQEVMIDPERVTKEEFEAAQTMSDIIWGTDGLAECLGPSWFLVHDPRFMAMERGWAREEAGMFGKRQKGISLVQALDNRSTIKLIEDPELYSEMIGEGRHFRDYCLKNGIDPKTLYQDKDTIWAIIAAECANYQRRDGSWNKEAHALAKLLEQDVVGLVDDYAELAYSQDWVRMDTGEVVDKTEEIWSDESGTQVPVIAVEVDTIHKALVMRSMVRMTALRLMRGFPGIKAEEFEAIQLTDNESDQICQLLFKTTYDKLYTVLPEIMTLVGRAKVVPFEERERTELGGFSATAREFIGKMKTGEIKPIITEIAEDPNMVANPAVFLSQISRDVYARGVFQVVQDLGERGDERAQDIATRLASSGGNYAVWGEAETYLESIKEHPYQHVLEGRELQTPEQIATLKRQLREIPIIIEGTREDETIYLTDETLLDIAVKVHSFLGNGELNPFLVQTVYHNGLNTTPPSLANMVKERAIAAFKAQQSPTVTTVEGEFLGSL